jgi:hypothetical protein
MSEGIRGLIKPDTINRLGKYAPVRLGMSSDELINAALDAIETGTGTVQVKADGKRRK